MDVEKTYICGSCGKGFRRSDNLKKHLLIHTGIRPYQCQVCLKSFRERNHLSSHLLLHTGEKPFKCTHCGKSFNQNSNLKKHIKIHTNDRPYVCDICDNKFTQQCYLNEHMKNHTGERDFECVECGKKFKNSSHLRSHLKTHSDERPYKCAFCDKTFKYVRNYSVHMMGHDGDASCRCMVCGKEFLNRNNLKIHMLVHSNVQLHECFVCGKEFQKIENFKRHLQAHTGERPFKCTECDEGFKSTVHLKFHMMLHTGEKPFTCTVCGSGFRSKSYLSSHMVSHNSERHCCNVCCKSFKYKCNYTRHMKTHAEETQNHTIRISTVTQQSSFTPEKVIITTPRLEPSLVEEVVPITHIVSEEDPEGTLPIVTEGEIVEEDQRITLISCSAQNERKLLELSGKRPVELSHCRNESTGTTSVKIHTRVPSRDTGFQHTHYCHDYHNSGSTQREQGISAIGRIDCIHCDKTFRENSQLQGQLGHSNEHLYKCHVCGKDFKHNSYLHAHLESHVTEKVVCSDSGHVGDEQCEVCGKRFARKYFLRRHMLVHTDERAFECTVCNKKFKDKAVLRTHTMIHTGERRYACNICDKKFIQSSDQRRHMKTHAKTVMRDKPYSCNVCGLKFGYRHNLDTHKLIHTMKKDADLNKKLDQGMEDGTDVGGISDENGQTKNIIHSIMGQFTIENFVPNFQTEETITHIISEDGIDDNAATVDQMESIAQEHMDYGVVEEEEEEESGVSKAKLYMGSTIPNDNFICVICGKDCVESNILKAHLKKHKPECPQCGKVFNRINNLKRHMVIHTGARPYQCNVCDKRFKENGHLKTHIMLLHTGERPYKCNHCNKQYAQKSNLIRHLKAHTEEKPFVCNICGLEFSLKQSFETHQIVHMKKNLIGNTELTQVTLEDHTNRKCLVPDIMNEDNIKSVYNGADERENEIVLTEDDLDGMTFRCTFCGKDFNKKSNLKRHVMTHTGERPYECSSCEKRFKEKKCRDEHEMTHLGIRPHVCIICHKKFTQRSVLNRHRKTHGFVVSQGDENVLVVEKSGSMKSGEIPHAERNPKCVRFSQNLTEEMPYHLLEPVVEIQVGKIAIQTISYEAAMKRRQMLRERRRHRCTVCGKSFNRKSNLARHVQCHKDNQIYRCTICKNEFKNKQHFDTHLLMHTSKFYHQCNTCKETFIEGNELKNHMRIHAVENFDHYSVSENQSPVLKSQQINASTSSQVFKEQKEKEESFECSTCGMKFQFKYHLENHRLIHELRKNIGLEKGVHHKIIVKTKGTKERDVSEKSCEGVIGIDQNNKESDRHLIIDAPSNSKKDVIGEIELGKITVKTLPYSLAIQRRTMSRGNKKRVKCGICEKDFSSNYNLKVHMRLHTGERPYICNICGKKFNQTSYLKTHISTHQR